MREHLGELLFGVAKRLHRFCGRRPVGAFDRRIGSEQIRVDAAQSRRRVLGRFRSELTVRADYSVDSLREIGE